MTDAEDLQASYDLLCRKVQPDNEPTLAPPDLEDILERHRRGQRWAAEGSLVYGTVIKPNIRNGHVYTVIAPGDSGDSEPDWPTTRFSTVVDGDVTLQEAGEDFDSIYDMRGALREVWETRMAMTAEYNEGDEAKIYEHCKEQAQRYATVIVI